MIARAATVFPEPQGPNSPIETRQLASYQSSKGAIPFRCNDNPSLQKRVIAMERKEL